MFYFFKNKIVIFNAKNCHSFCELTIGIFKSVKKCVIKLTHFCSCIGKFFEFPIQEQNKLREDAHSHEKKMSAKADRARRSKRSKSL